MGVSWIFAGVSWRWERIGVFLLGHGRLTGTLHESGDRDIAWRGHFLYIPYISSSQLSGSLFQTSSLVLSIGESLV